MSTLKEPWTLAEGARPLLWSGTFLISCFLVVSFSTNTFNRWIVFFFLAIPAAYNTFQTSENLSPDDTLNDIYMRFVIIFSSHVVYLCFNPSVSHDLVHKVKLTANTNRKTNKAPRMKASGSADTKCSSTLAAWELPGNCQICGVQVNHD